MGRTDQPISWGDGLSQRFQAAFSLLMSRTPTRARPLSACGRTFNFTARRTGSGSISGIHPRNRL